MKISMGEKKRTKKGAGAKQGGGLLMVIGVLISIISGAFTAPAAILFFCGLVLLIVGVAQRDSDNT
jgi:uncharacterized membrane protein